MQNFIMELKNIAGWQILLYFPKVSENQDTKKDLFINIKHIKKKDKMGKAYNSYLINVMINILDAPYINKYLI